MDNINVYIEKCRENAKIPSYANEGDAGVDVCSTENVIINPGETKIIKTGLKFAIPKGYEIQVRPRSGISFKTPIRISNSPGTIDSGYRDELGIIITNTSETNINNSTVYKIDSKDNKKGVYKICEGDRIAQLVLSKVPMMNFKVVDSVKSIGENRGGGFGSTGV
jgi:dUTP pyrophosphatase